MRPRAGTWIGRVQRLAQAGIWITQGAMWVLVSVSSGWVFVACGCTGAFCLVFLIANLAAAGALPGGRRWGRGRKGGGISGHGRDDDDGSAAGEAAHRRHSLVMVSRLMPAAAGRRWLAEAASVLAELTGARRDAALRSYLLSAPQLAVMMWARVILRRARPGPRRPG